MKNLIWLTEEENEDIITQARFIIKDNNGYKELIKKLKGIDNYILAYCECDCNGRGIKYTADGVIKYEKSYDRDYLIKKVYKNPRSEVYKLIIGNYDANLDFIDLFKTMEYSDSIYNSLKEFQLAQKTLIRLYDSQIDKKTLNLILNRLWPNFGFFATECLNYTDFETLYSYDINEINSLAENCGKRGVSNPKEVDEILENKVRAQNNGRVLSLARKIHKMSK